MLVLFRLGRSLHIYRRKNAIASVQKLKSNREICFIVTRKIFIIGLVCCTFSERFTGTKLMPNLREREREREILPESWEEIVWMLANRLPIWLRDARTAGQTPAVRTNRSRTESKRWCFVVIMLEQFATHWSLRCPTWSIYKGSARHIRPNQFVFYYPFLF